MSMVSTSKPSVDKAKAERKALVKKLEDALKATGMPASTPGDADTVEPAQRLLAALIKDHYASAPDTSFVYSLPNKNGYMKPMSESLQVTSLEICSLFVLLQFPTK